MDASCSCVQTRTANLVPSHWDMTAASQLYHWTEGVFSNCCFSRNPPLSALFGNVIKVWSAAVLDMKKHGLLIVAIAKCFLYPRPDLLWFPFTLHPKYWHFLATQHKIYFNTIKQHLFEGTARKSVYCQVFSTLDHAKCAAYSRI